MDNMQLTELANKSSKLKYKFAGVWASDTFPKLKPDSFLIVNASPLKAAGSHWLLLTRLAEASNDAAITVSVFFLRQSGNADRKVFRNLFAMSKPVHE